MTDDLDSRSRNGGEANTDDKSDGALMAVAKGLSHEPVLLFGFGVVLVLGTAGQVMGGRLLPVGWLIAGVYAASLITWAAIQRGRAGGGTGTTVIPGQGAPEAPTHPAGSGGMPSIRILNAKTLKSPITGTGNQDEPGIGPMSIVIDNTGSKESPVTGVGNIGPKSRPRNHDA